MKEEPQNIGYYAETIRSDNPTFALVDALIEAGVPEHLIDWDRVGTLRRHVNSSVWVNVSLPKESE